MPTLPLISIVDDDDAFKSSLEDLVRSAGWRAQGFASAEAFMRSPHRQETACLILDVRMPGMSGPELQRRLVEADAAIPIIFITAHVDEGVRTRALQEGVVAFLYKPFREEDLLHAVDAALNGS
jgi:FixJ family two-component response regulator